MSFKHTSVLLNECIENLAHWAAVVTLMKSAKDLENMEG